MHDEFNTDVWEMDWLLHKYQIDVVNEIVHQAWVIDELNAGVELSEIEDSIWKDYKAWAEKFLLDAKEERMSNYE